jgi:hypothetical protein
MPKTSPHPDSRIADAITTRPRQDKPQRSLRENIPQNLDDEWSVDMAMLNTKEIRSNLLQLPSFPLFAIPVHFCLLLSVLSICSRVAKRLPALFGLTAKHARHTNGLATDYTG